MQTAKILMSDTRVQTNVHGIIIIKSENITVTYLKYKNIVTDKITQTNK